MQLIADPPWVVRRAVAASAAYALGPVASRTARYLRGADGDQAIPPDAQPQFAPRMGGTTVEVSTNHVAVVSHPDEVLQLIKTAAEAVPAAT